MKSLDELDHYEVLELEPGARYDEVERAYQLTRAAYAEGSMALYSVFSSADAEVMRSRIDEAYRILADPDDRKSYDEAAGIQAAVAEPTPGGSDTEMPLSGAGTRRIPSAFELASKTSGEVPTAIDVFEELDAEIDEDEHGFGGAALRRARLRRGIELGQISDLTKISNTYLSHIEAEEFDSLPATVYVRGFVMAYARAIGLDPDRVVASYMERVDEARNASKRSRIPDGL